MPRHALARKFDQKHAVPFADVMDLDAPFVDLAPMNDDLLISTARCGNSHHSFHRNRTLAAALEFDPHGAPPFRFMARCRGQFAAVRGSPPQLCLSTRIVARIGEDVNSKLGFTGTELADDFGVKYSRIADPMTPPQRPGGGGRGQGVLGVGAGSRQG